MGLGQAIELNPILHDRLQVTEAAIERFCQRWKIVELALFGSVLRDDFRVAGDDPSDVDVLVVFAENHGWNLFQVMDMERELEEMFHRKVDLLQKKQLKNPYRRHNILKTHQVIYG